MLAFYVWTDTLLVNAVRVKCSDFPSEEADLFVLELTRLSQDLLEEVENRSLFRRVIRIRPPEGEALSLLGKCLKLFRREFYYQKYCDCLSEAAEDGYRMLFTGGFWSYTLFLYRFLRSRAPKLSIAFLEEGAATYNGLPTLTRCDPLGKLRSLLYRLFFYRDIYPAAITAAKRIYLHYPDAAVHAGALSLHSIGRDTADTEAILARYTASLRIEPYCDRQVIFFLQPESEASRQLTIRNIRTAAQVFGAEQLTVKTHPSEPSPDCIAELPENVCVEQSGVSFDFIVDRVDWTDKLLIAKGSSCVFYPCYLCRQQPAILFTHEMYKQDHGRDVPLALTQHLRELYQDHDRVMSAQNEAQFFQYMISFREHKKQTTVGGETC